MDWGRPAFVLAIIALVMAAGLMKTWIRAKHGYPLEDGKRARRAHRRAMEGDTLAEERKVQLLTSENERLTGQVGRLEERIAVLERIVTDPAERTAREIDALR